MMGLCCYVAGSILAIEVRVNPLPIAFAAAILYGVAFGWTFVCLNAITARFYGPSAYPKLNGMMLLPTSVACAPAGIVGGAVFDKLGSYTGAFALNMALAIIGIFALSSATAPAIAKKQKPGVESSHLTLRRNMFAITPPRQKRQSERTR